MSLKIEGRRLVDADGPKIGAAAVRELTGTPLPTTADLERGEHGDGEPRAFGAPTRPNPGILAILPDLAQAVEPLSPEDARALLWVARSLPGLEARCREIKLEGCEPSYQADGVTPTANDFKHPTPRGHVALGALLSLMRAWRVAGEPGGGK